MNFDWSEEQLERRAATVRFAEEVLNNDNALYDKENRFAREEWDRCAEFGLLALSVPEQYSERAETDFMTAMLAMEGFGYGCRDNGLCFAINAQNWTVQLPLFLFGNDQQKEKYLPRLSKGELISAHAITELEAGSDVFSMAAHARKHNDGYLLNGSKHYVSLAPIADLFLIFATSDPDAGKWGISAFVVEKDTKGLVVGPMREKMGLRTVPMGDITFVDCFIPECNRVGPEGGGLGISVSSLEWERCCILASQLGAMERQLAQTVEHANGRRQFGQRIGSFQSISNRIVDMKVRLETSRLLLYKVAYLKSVNKTAMLEAAMLKLCLSEGFVQSGLDAIQIHGAKGYMSAEEIERDLRDAVGGTIYAGTSEIQRNIIAGLMGLRSD